MKLASGRPRAMLFVDGSNFLIELFSQLGVEKRATHRSPVHAINLVRQVIHSSVYQNFLFLVLGAGRIWGSFASISTSLVNRRWPCAPTAKPSATR